MTASKKIPRIQSISKVDGFRVYCLFNTGEKRVIDFEELFSLWKIQPTDIEYNLLDLAIFQKVKLRDGVLSWDDVPVYLKDQNQNEAIFPYEIDPIVLFNHSQPVVEVEVEAMV